MTSAHHNTASPLIYWYHQLRVTDIPFVGGKNASLGEMISQLKETGIKVPVGFATSAQLFRDFLKQNQLDEPIAQLLADMTAGAITLTDTGEKIRALIAQGRFTTEQEEAITLAYQQLCEQLKTANVSVAVRSSATAEDLPDASFAGQQESYLNICGHEQVLQACQQCFASLYTDRAIVYRQEKGFAHQQVALSVGIQQMVESEAAGVMFSLDTENGFPDVVIINGAWGLGETIVKGSVTPDRFMVYKPLLEKPGKRPIIEKQPGNKQLKMIYASQHHKDDPDNGQTVVLPTTEQERCALVLSDDEILQLARWAVIVERHYGCAMDMEWAKDSQGLYLVQARPETVESQKQQAVLVNYSLKEKSTLLLEGASVGSAIATGQVCLISDPHQTDQFPQGAILVTERTDPDWVPLMRKAAGIITDTGGPTSHAAIVSRELKVPAIVGTEHATRSLTDGQAVTLSCAGGTVGQVYEGILRYDTQQVNLDEIPRTQTAVMINAAMPDGVFRWWQLPVDGIGLTRIEFMISSQIRVHPMALLHPEKVTDPAVRQTINQLTEGYAYPPDYFTHHLGMGVGKIAASQYPKPVIVRMSDFKSNEYRGLLGGEFFELHEENPMLGLRGASRYYHQLYREAFKLECQAIVKARQEMGFDNIIVMIPFCRTTGEADKVLDVMAEAGLKRGENGLQVYVMCEIPSNVILADRFAQRFDGFSIGSNDLTQLVLGIDRDSAELKPLFDARDDAVKEMIARVITVAHQYGCKVGICGQAPSDYPEFAEFLVNCGIDSISLNPDSFAKGCQQIAQAELKYPINTAGHE
ncbi:phosphoenolpyruvate synthase [Photobacterium halotolerans]|uniref:phosphoenolpyruvate synthase n=1 Tax=Photobacterium halotolerans TaxID=265726 RepID=UPI0013724DA1|nr:phosphoenolpyruvate synthase [Photobacterium halotolerans]NAX48145.1 phosphoenolpyruvate synthase [Photobacterium halotolerans]